MCFRLVNIYPFYRNNATDNTLISVLLSTEMVGYFSNYSIIIAKLNGLVWAVFYSLISSLGNLIAKESNELRYQYFGRRIP